MSMSFSTFYVHIMKKGLSCHDFHLAEVRSPAHDWLVRLFQHWGNRFQWNRNKLYPEADVFQCVREENSSLSRWQSWVKTGTENRKQVHSIYRCLFSQQTDRILPHKYRGKHLLSLVDLVNGIQLVKDTATSQLKLQRITDSIYNFIMGNKMLRESIWSLVLIFFSFVSSHMRRDRSWLESSFSCHGQKRQNLLRRELDAACLPGPRLRHLLTFSFYPHDNLLFSLSHISRWWRQEVEVKDILQVSDTDWNWTKDWLQIQILSLMLLHSAP
jgi:hypothetical protein